LTTNIILDHLCSRQPYSASAGKILRLCFQQDCTGYIAAHSITNIFYIIRGQFSASDRKRMLLDLCGFIDVVGIQKKQIIDALNNDEFMDLEDRVQFECAKIINARYIITRNIADYPNSPISAILPEDFLKIIEERQIHA
jgi:hypothetical protein